MMLDKKTSMLYNASTMNNKPNIPDEVMLYWKNYSFWADMKVNGWLIVAALTAGVGDIWLPYNKDCPFMLRVIIALAPLPASLFWVRDVARWIRGMDELHRRITLGACLFATTCTLFVIAAWQRFKQEVIMGAIFQPSRLHFENIAFTEYELTLGLVFVFYLLGRAIFNRRYK
jgi:hypothetical protein